MEALPEGGSASGGGYIEGCWQFYTTANESFPGLVVGTGVEDYFDSGYYFGADSGDPVGVPFFNALSGLPLFQRVKTGLQYERLSAYRFHNTDPLVMSDGGKLQWRVGAKGEPGTTKCGNPLPPSPGPSPVAGDTFDPHELQMENLNSRSENLGRALSPINVTTYAWIYTLPATN